MDMLNGLPHKQKADQVSDLVFVCRKADEQGNFGAALHTTLGRTEDGCSYYRHFLVNVQADGPAMQMKIGNNDEIVLLNEMFAPTLSHKDVLNQFCHLKMDGNTALTLVLQRRRNRKNWEWIETSAVLVADETKDNSLMILLRASFYKIISLPTKLFSYLQATLGIPPKGLQSEMPMEKLCSTSVKSDQKVMEIAKIPIFEHLQYRELKGETTEVPGCKLLYKVTGTQHFLNISDGSVSTAILKGDSSDRTKVICRRAKYWMRDSKGNVDYAAALCDVTMSWYIAVNHRNEITLKNKPHWFKMVKTGSKVRFKVNELYLGYTRGSTNMKLHETPCTFEEMFISDSSNGNNHRNENGLRLSETASYRLPRHLSFSSIKMVPRLLKLLVR